MSDKNAPPRGWVVRLGQYLHIFGVGKAPSEPYIDSLAKMAQEREVKHAKP